jgi:hypothetical protein
LTTPSPPFGKYNPYPNQLTCVSCPPFESVVFCPENSTFLSVPLGFWSNGTVMVKCIPQEACPAGNFTRDFPLTCAEGYSNDYCSECTSDYFRINGLCKKCMPQVVFWIVLTLVFISIVFSLNALLQTLCSVERESLFVLATIVCLGLNFKTNIISIKKTCMTFTTTTLTI